MLIWVGVIAGAIVVAGAMFVGLKASIERERAREVRRLRAASIAPIRDLTSGARVRVIGTARKLERELVSPYGKQPCLAFDAEQRATLEGGDHDITMKPPPSREAVAFRVEDETGTVEIDVEKVELALKLSVIADAKDLQGKVFGAKIIARQATTSSYTEGILAPGDRVAVTGTAHRRDDGTWQLRADEAAVLISNDPDAFG